MQVNRLFLLLAIVAMIFLPALSAWALDVRTAWYRPFLLWALVAVGLYINQRSRGIDEL